MQHVAMKKKVSARSAKLELQMIFSNTFVHILFFSFFFVVVVLLSLI